MDQLYLLKINKSYKRVFVFINKIVSSHYPGRASGGPILDLFITLLSMGK